MLFRLTQAHVDEYLIHGWRASSGAQLHRAYRTAIFDLDVRSLPHVSFLQSLRLVVLASQCFHGDIKYPPSPSPSQRLFFYCLMGVMNIQHVRCHCFAFKSICLSSEFVIYMASLIVDIIALVSSCEEQTLSKEQKVPDQAFINRPRATRRPALPQS